MDWDKLKIFHNVALDLNISEAAHKMNISHSSISRQISALERDLKVSLFKRHARGLTLTEQGKILFKTAHDIFGKIALTEAKLTESKEKPTGPLTIAATVAFGTTWLAPRIEKFTNSYPEIDVSIIIENKYTDLAQGEADVALRLTEPTQMDLIRFPLYEFQFKIYSSPEYIEKFGIPKDVSELPNHKIVAFGDSVEPSIPDVNCILDLLPKNKKVKTLFISNMYGVMRAIGGGAGIGALPEYMRISNNNLVPILPNADTPKTIIYFTYPPELKGSKKIEALRDFLVREVNKEKKS
ncbi:LysR family transcriptional regulator [Alphaproteobacteria bacterium]|jgi:DNA-binding transcriptional LysR family regulator|nr:LysR family transcriptional regulator [Alphaproteobacteria bacterium]MDC3149431.1 LysR family transcriptional regulator [Alphaproteobacteria bacterium]|tara:strand:- start:301 stop:1188 length:888 start_codon:yes stop_codon:yes gene_type:complete